MNEATLRGIRNTAEQMFPAGTWLVAERDPVSGWRVRMFDLTRERAEDALDFFPHGSVFNVKEWNVQKCRPLNEL